MKNEVVVVVGAGGIVMAIARRQGLTDLLFFKDPIEAGKLVPVIDRRYPLAAVAEALRYREEGHAQGKLVMTIRHGHGTGPIPEPVFPAVAQTLAAL